MPTEHPADRAAVPAWDQLPPPIAEQPPPTRFAELKIKVGPDRSGASVQGSVPPDQAHHLVTALSIWGSVATGITGAVLTQRIGSGFGVQAMAELIAGLVAAVLITAVSFAQSRRQKPDAGTPRGH